MKKLFVLFLLVALVPFTVGCSLFGSNYDDPEVPPTFKTASAKAVIPGALLPSIRAAAINEGDDFYGWKIIKNDIVLTAFDSTDNGDGTFTVQFKNDKLTQAQADTANAEVFTLTIENNAGDKKVTGKIINLTGKTGEVTIVVTGLNVVQIKIGNGTPQDEFVGENPFTIVGVKYNTVALGTSGITNVTPVATLTPKFEIELSKSVDFTTPAKIEEYWLDLVAVFKNANNVKFEMTEELVDELFVVEQTVAGATFTVQLNLMAEPQRLNDDKTYSVEIQNFKIKDGTETAIATPKTFFFKVALPQSE